MPRKKYKKRNQTQKQLKIIQARLMKISLKMDNYIYKNRPISVNDAQKYYQEVTSYKTQCEDSARILQVIDKLKHQLKALLEEGQDSTSYYNVQEIIENSISTCPLSPTYSHNDDRDAPGAPANDIMAVEKDNYINLDKQAETIDLCSDTDFEETNLTQTETLKDASSSNIKDIERSLSNLTVNTENAKETQNVAKNAVYNEIIPYLFITGCQRSDDNTKTIMDIVSIDTQKQRCADSVPYNIKQGQDIIKVGGGINTTDKNATINDITNSVTTTRKLEVNIPKKKRRASKSKQNDSNKSVNEKHKKQRRIKKNCTQDTTINTDKITNNDCIKSVPPQCTVNSNKLKRPVQDLAHVKPHSLNALYNNNVENDLSWMENIRYIREVAPDEMDLKLSYLDDNFWLTSGNFNDQDFMY